MREVFWTGFFFSYERATTDMGDLPVLITEEGRGARRFVVHFCKAQRFWPSAVFTQTPLIFIFDSSAVLEGLDKVVVHRIGHTIMASSHLGLLPFLLGTHFSFFLSKPNLFFFFFAD